jgi:hypothetical protein
MFGLAFLAPVAKFLAPYLSKAILWIVIVVAVVGGLWYLDPYRAKAAQLQAQIAQDQANAVALQKRTALIIQQLTSDAADAQAAALHYASIKRNISNAPHTASCAGSPAIRSALDGLRDQTAAGGPPAH